MLDFIKKILALRKYKRNSSFESHFARIAEMPCPPMPKIKPPKFLHGVDTMDCNLKTDLTLQVNAVLAQLQNLDETCKHYFNTVPAIQLEPSAPFMAAWNDVKRARDILAKINLKEVPL